MRAHLTSLASLLALSCLGLAADPPPLAVVPPEGGIAVPKDGKVPAVTWTVEWSLRDDKKPSMGGLATHRTFASAQAAAAKKLADRGEAGSYWYIKSVVIKAEAELVNPDDLPAAQKRLWKAIQAGIDKKAEACNFLVRDIAAAAKAKGVGDKTADELWAYFNTAAAKDGWVEVKGEKAKGAMPAVSAIEKANRLADEGQLVIGVISKELLNKYKAEGREDYKQGHVFGIAPAGGTDWKTTLTANAVYDPKTPTAAGYTPANKVIATDKQREVVQFFAIPLPAE